MSTSPGGSTLRRAGAAAWAWLGIIAFGAVLVVGLSTVSGLVVPFVVAVVVAMLLVPLVDRLDDRGLPRPAGALLVLLGFVGLLTGVVWLAVEGVASQWSTVTADVRSGLAATVDWLVARGVEVESPGQLLRQGLDLLGTLAAGPSGAVAGALGTVTSFLVGTGIAVFLLFLLLSDWHRLAAWVGQRLWVPAAVGTGMVDDVVDAVRRYYVALTVSSALVSAVIAATAWLLGVPLALAIGVVTFVTSYVPFLGAIVSGSFAVLVALGATGPVEALVLLLVVLAVQNVVQTVVQAKLTGDALQLHPIVTFSVTIAGAAVAGILGASLAVPVLAAARRVVVRLRAHRDAPDPGLTTALTRSAPAEPSPPRARRGRPRPPPVHDHGDVPTS